MMVVLSIILGLLAFGGAVVIYSTLARNRWGINSADFFCPRCNTFLPKQRKAQSFRQAMWGGCMCPNCGTEVDKWGRELHGREDQPLKLHESPLKTDQVLHLAEISFFDRFRGHSSTFWVITILWVLFNAVYDYYSPRAIVFDVIALVILFVWYGKSART